MGALVSWSPLVREALVDHQVLPQELRESVQAETQWATTDVAGRFSFLEPLSVADIVASVLWATSPGLRAEALLIDGEAPEAIGLVLSAADGFRVQVVDSRGQPVSGAVVEEFGLRPPARLQHDPLWRAAARTFLRTGRSGEDGLLSEELSSALVSVALQARSGTSRSVPWLQFDDPASDPIVLRLEPLFTVDGRVSIQDPILLTDLRVQCLLIRGRLPIVVADSEVSPQGAWGPLSVPWQDNAEYIVRLTGSVTEVQERRLDGPEPGKHFHIEFEALAGAIVPMVVQDSQGQAIPGAEVALTWEQAGGDHVTLFAYSDQGGIVRASGIHPGYVRIRARATGFADTLLDWREVGSSVHLIVITLERETQVLGRVLYRGEGVRDFTVVWWTDALFEGSGALAQEFKGREKGEFELTGLPATSVKLMATAENASHSEALALELAPGIAQTVTLELQGASKARGQLVDASTGDPVVDASVQLWLNTGPAYIHPKGAAVAVDLEGRFELDGLAPGDNRFVVDAPGYARHLGTATGGSPNAADIGRIPLLQVQPIEVVLVVEEPTDFSGWSLKVIGTAFQGPVAFSPGGLAQVEHCSPGWSRLVIEEPSGGSLVHSVLLLPGREWLFEVPVVTGGSLEVIVEPAGEEKLPEGLWIEVLHAPMPGRRVTGNWIRRSTRANEDGRAVFRGIPVGELVVEAWDEGGTVAAAQVGHMTSQGASINLALGGRSHAFLVLDQDGQPTVGAEIHVASPSQAPGWFTTSSTDAEGMAQIWYLPVDRVQVSVIHPDAGRVFDVPVDVASDPTPTVVVLEAECSIHARLMSAGSPLPGVGVSILAAGSTYIVGNIVSDADGIIHVDSVSDSAYQLIVSHPGYWPQTIEIDAHTSDEPVHVRVHRLGELEFQAHATTGAVVTGLPIYLVHEELGRYLEQWIADGLLPSPPGGCATDSQGVLRLSGVPEGTYTWRVAWPEVGELSGTVEIEPKGKSRVEIALP